MSDHQHQHQQQCTTKIQLFLHASKLPRTGRLRSAPDTFAQVSIVPPQSSEGDGVETKPIPLGTTEVFKRSSEPRWAKVFPIQYEYGTSLTVFVDVLSLKSSGRRSKISSSASAATASCDNCADCSGEETADAAGGCDYMGGAFFDLGDLLGCRNRTKAKRLRKGGCVFAHIEPIRTKDPSSSTSIAPSEGIVIFQMSALHLKDTVSSSLSRKVHMSSKPNTYLEISRQTVSPSGSTWVVVYRSSPVMESLKPMWDRVELDVETFCNGDLDRPILLSIFSLKKGGKSRLIGSFETSVNVLVNSVQREGAENEMEGVFILRKGEHRGDEEVGRIAIIEASILLDGEGSAAAYSGVDGGGLMPVDLGMGEMYGGGSGGAAEGTTLSSLPPDGGISDTFNVAMSQGDGSIERGGGGDSSIAQVMQTSQNRPSFLDYVENRCEVDFCVAIDFTSSNGDPRYPDSLHYNRDGTMNDYEETILAVGGAVANYNSTKEFPVWGFGAKYSGEVRHIFQCGPSKTARDVDGVLDAYRSVFLTDLIMSGPTVLLHVIQAAAARARRFHANAKTEMRYCVLLILTDGIVTDLAATKAKLTAISELPLSVVIVGLGRADFREMHQLNDPPGVGRRANSTFAEFRPHQHDPQSLSQVALQHVPDQLVEYFVRNGIYPKRRSRSKNKSSVTIDSAISDLSIDDLM